MKDAVKSGKRKSQTHRDRPPGWRRTRGSAKISSKDFCRDLGSFIIDFFDLWVFWSSLSLVKRIIEDYHKGKIFIESSSEEDGTTFGILLPKI